jgi:hypothetical protein
VHEMAISIFMPYSRRALETQCATDRIAARRFTGWRVLDVPRRESLPLHGTTSTRTSGGTVRSRWTVSTLIPDPKRSAIFIPFLS